jgi:hypothetical protein
MPDDAITVSALLDEFGYKVSASQAEEHLRQLGNGGSDPTFLAIEDGQVPGLSHCASVECCNIRLAEPQDAPSG